MLVTKAQGTLPAGLGSLSNALTLDLSRNSFSGCMPFSLQAHTCAFAALDLHAHTR